MIVSPSSPAVRAALRAAHGALGRRAEMATVRESIHQKLQETGEKDRCVPTHRRSRPGAVRGVTSRAVRHTPESNDTGLCAHGIIMTVLRRARRALPLCPQAEGVPAQEPLRLWVAR